MAGHKAKLEEAGRAREVTPQVARAVFLLIIVAIRTEVVEKVRKTMRAPSHGFPAHAELAIDDAPCRHRSRTFVAVKSRRILLTYDRLEGMERCPSRGRLDVHEDCCARYESALEAYGQDRRLLELEYVADGKDT